MPFILVALFKAACHAYQLPTVMEAIWRTSRLLTLSHWQRAAIVASYKRIRLEDCVHYMYFVLIICLAWYSLEGHLEDAQGTLAVLIISGGLSQLSAAVE